MRNATSQLTLCVLRYQTTVCYNRRSKWRGVGSALEPSGTADVCSICLLLAAHLQQTCTLQCNYDTVYCLRDKVTFLIKAIRQWHHLQLAIPKWKAAQSLVLRIRLCLALLDGHYVPSRGAVVWFWEVISLNYYYCYCCQDYHLNCYCLTLYTR